MYRVRDAFLCQGDAVLCKVGVQMYQGGCISVYRWMPFRVRWVQKRVGVPHDTKMHPSLKKEQGFVMFLVLVDDFGREEVVVF